MDRPYGDRHEERVEREELEHERHLMRVDHAWEEWALTVRCPKCGIEASQACQITERDIDRDDGVGIHYMRLDEVDTPSEPSISVRAVSGGWFETNRRRH